MNKFCLYVVYILVCALITTPAWAEGEIVVYPGQPLQIVGAFTDVLAPSGSGGGKSLSLSGNNVTLNRGSVELVVGALNINDTDSVTGNQVFVKGGEVNDRVYGGGSNNGNVVGNSVTISGGKNAYVYGGFSEYGGNVTANTVAISGGTLNMPVYGGLSNGAGNATANTVAISNGSLNGEIVGGASAFGNATGNTVSISGKPSFAAGCSILGGYAPLGDEFSGNTLKLDIPITVERVANFENYEFIIPSSVRSGSAVLTVTGFAPVNLVGTTLDIAGIASGSKLKPGDTIILVSKASGAPAYASGTDIVTSFGTWKFSSTSGMLTATVVSLPSSGGGGGGGGCNAFGGLGILALAMLFFTRKGR